MSLADCIAKAAKNINGADKALLTGIRDDLIAQGISEDQADRAALGQYIESIQAEAARVAELAGKPEAVQQTQANVTDNKPPLVVLDQAAARSIEDLEAELKTTEGLKSLSVFDSGDDIKVMDIQVEKGRRKEGVGSSVMEQLAEYADATGRRIILSPGQKDDHHGTTSRSRLVKFYKRFGFVENKGRNKDFSISEGMYREPDAAEIGNLLAQGRADGAPNASNRATIELFPDRRIIRLTEAKDESSFIHEAGHLFLDMEAKFADKYGVTENQQNLLNWLGVESFTDIDLSTPEGVEIHEKFARAFEAYMWEGKAPSEKLRPVFDAFKNWMRRVYRSLRGMNVELDDNIRQVFDRLLATEEEISLARDAPDYTDLFDDAQQAEMSDQEWKDYVDQSKRSQSVATSKVEKEMLSHYTRLATEKWNDELAATRERIEDQLRDSPEYKLLERIRETPMDRDATRVAMGLDPRSTGPRQPGAPDFSKDSLLVAAAKAGGLNMSEWRKDGVDPASMRDKAFNNQVFGRPIFRQGEGMLPDDLAEFANQFGYGQNISANDAVDLVMTELGGVPVYTLEGVISNAEREENFDEIYAAEQDKKRLISRINGVTAKSGGADPELVAETNGYRTVEDMLADAFKAFPVRKMARDMAEQEMLQKHGDMLNDGTIEAKVQEALHDEERAKLMLIELKKLTGNPRREQLKVERANLKNMARDTIGKMRYQQIRPDKYRRAEMKAAVAAKEAVLAGKKDEAAKQKRIQIGNFYLYKEARQARVNADKWRKHIDGVGRREYKPTTVAPPYAQNMRALALVHDMRKGADRTKGFSTVVAWLDGQLSAENSQFDLTLLDDRLIKAVQVYRDNNGVLPEDFPVPTRKDMTMDDLHGLYDQLRHLRYVGGQLAEGEKAAFKREALKLSGSIRDSKKKDFVQRHEGATKRQQVAENLRMFRGGLAGVFNHLRQLDGFEEGGEAATMIYSIIHDATGKKRDLNNQIMDAARKEMDGLRDLGLRKIDYQSFVKEDGSKFELSAEGRFMFAVYWGTESSRQALLEGHNVSEREAQKILESLDPDQLKMVNAVWKVNESMAGEFFGVANRMLGVAPEKIAPAPFVVNGVEMTGGHMQLFYDSFETQIKEERESMANIGKMMPNRQGSTHNRVGSGGKPVLLDKNNIFRSIDQKVHYMAFAEPAKELNRLINNAEVSAAIKQKHGDAFLKSFVESIEGIVGNREVKNDIPLVAGMSRWLRSAATAKHLMFSLRNVVQQPGAIYIALRDVGTVPMLKGIVDFASGKGGIAQQKSSFMRDRAKVVNREAAEYLRETIPDGPAAEFSNFLRSRGFAMQTWIDSLVAYPTWLAKYERGILEHGDEARAIREADITVSESVGSGANEHLGAHFQQTNSEWVKTLTVFGTWFNAYYQRVYRDSKGFTSINAKALESALMTPLIVATITQVLIADIPEDWDEWPEWMRDNYLSFSLGVLPVFRELASIHEGFTPTTPVGGGGKALYSLAVDVPSRIIEGEDTAAEMGIRAGKAVSQLAPIPGSGQILRAIEGFLDPDQSNIYAKIVEGKQRN